MVIPNTTFIIKQEHGTEPDNLVKNGRRTNLYI